MLLRRRCLNFLKGEKMTRNLPSSVETGVPHHHPKHHHGSHEGSHHGRHHSPAGLHLIPRRIDEMRRRGAPDAAIQEILEAFKDKLPKSVLRSLETGSHGDLAVTLGKSAEAANAVALDLLGLFSDGGILIAGELPPHLICGLMDSGIGGVQVCDPSHHGHRPPHFRDMEAWYPGFTGVVSLTEISDDSVQVIVLHAFMSTGDSLLVCPLALMATRLWPEAKVVAVMSDHRAPHHVVELSRLVEQYLFWE
jgi:hypothetical protein